jgi:hypothetical protein
MASAIVWTTESRMAMACTRIEGGWRFTPAVPDPGFADLRDSDWDMLAERSLTGGQDARSAVNRQYVRALLARPENAAVLAVVVRLEDTVAAELT